MDLMSGLMQCAMCSSHEAGYQNDFRQKNPRGMLLFAVRSALQELVKEPKFCVQYVKCVVKPINAKFIHTCDVTITTDTASSGVFI